MACGPPSLGSCGAASSQPRQSAPTAVEVVPGLASDDFRRLHGGTLWLTCAACGPRGDSCSNAVTPSPCCCQGVRTTRWRSSGVLRRPLQHPALHGQRACPPMLRRSLISALLLGIEQLVWCPALACPSAATARATCGGAAAAHAGATQARLAASPLCSFACRKSQACHYIGCSRLTPQPRRLEASCRSRSSHRAPPDGAPARWFQFEPAEFH